MILIARTGKAYRGFVFGFVISALLAVGSIAAPVQQSASRPESTASADKIKAADAAAKPAAPMTPDEARQVQLRADTERLYKLTQELKEEVAKSNKDTLSVSVIKKAEEVEKLAKSLKVQIRAAR